jgi:hypothetical protein
MSIAADQAERFIRGRVKAGERASILRLASRSKTCSPQAGQL